MKINYQLFSNAIAVYINEMQIKKLIISDYEQAKNEVIFSLQERVASEDEVNLVAILAKVVDEYTDIKEEWNN